MLQQSRSRGTSRCVSNYVVVTLYYSVNFVFVLHTDMMMMKKVTILLLLNLTAVFEVVDQSVGQLSRSCYITLFNNFAVK